MAGPASRRTVAGMTTTTTPHTPAPERHTTAWQRVFARIYDPLLWLGERRGLQARRRELLAQARGLTVEIGGGTGLNLPLYPTSVGRLVLAEPDEAMRTKLKRRVEHERSGASVIDASAEDLPFADGSVETIVSTLVLCTVDSPRLALREIARVLAPGAP